MSAVWMLARAELRARWRAWLVLAVLIGVGGGIALTTGAGARRTLGSFQRLLDVTKARDVIVQENDDPSPGLLDRVAALPEVAASGRLVMVPADVVAPAGTPFGWSVTAGAFGDEGMGKDVDVPRLLAGRRPDQADPYEAAVSRDFLSARGLKVGDTFPMRTVTLDELLQLFAGTPPVPSGPVVAVRIVGVVQMPDDVGFAKENQGLLLLTRAFHETFAPRIAALDVMVVRLRRGLADFGSFSDGARRVAGGDQVLGITTGDYLKRQVGDSLRAQSGALWLFTGVVALALVVLLGQLLGRTTALGSDASAGAVPLGAGFGITFGALMLPVTFVAAIGGLIAALMGVAGSAAMPVGGARALDPALGIRVDALVVGAGAGLWALMFVARGAATAWRLARRRARAERARPATLPDALARAGASATLVSGSRFAFDPGRGRNAVPVGAVLFGIIAGILALASSATFESSFRHLLGTPSTYGFNWDLVVAGGEDEELVEQGTGAIAASPLVAASAVMRHTTITHADRDLSTMSIRAVRGYVGPLVLEGRTPQGDDEVALGGRTMRDAGVGIGDRIAFAGAAAECGGTEGCRVDYRVTGRIVFWDEEGSPGEGALLTTGGQDRLAGANGFSDHVVRLQSGATADALLTSLEREESEVIVPRAPVEVQNLGQARPLIAALTVVLGAFALATTAMALVTAISRRSRDLGVLKVLGFVRGQIRRTVAWHASLLVAVSLAVAVPLGVMAGRWVWALLANGIGISPEPAVDALRLAAGSIGLILLANAIAVWPARRAARTHPAVILRAE